MTLKHAKSTQLEIECKGFITTPHLPVKGVDFSVKLVTEAPIKEGERLIRRTLSVCPECKSLLRAAVFEKDGSVLIRKVCPDHGEYEEVYWSDAEFYKLKSKEAADGLGIENPYVEITNPCPYNCGLCGRHKSHTALLNIVVTNRCDLGCWYCFFYSHACGFVYEPSLDQIRFMLSSGRKQLPIPAKAVQLTGGEPLLRDDIIEIVRIAKELGYDHVQVNTTGIRLMYEPELARELRKADVNTIYMSFDGVSPISNPKNHWEAPYILETLKRCGLGAVLVPTVIKSMNLHEVGKIVAFGLKFNEIVRGVNFQPISIVGRVPKKERDALRVTIPDIIKVIEEESNGQIRREDWYTVPITIPVSKFVEALTKKPQFTMSNHFACGAATYVLQDKKTNKIVTLPQLIDVYAFVDYLNRLTDYINNGGSRKIALLKLLFKINKFVNWEKVPENLRKRKRFLRLLFDIFAKHNYKALGELHYNSLFLGIMHFMDEYNYDVARVERCDVHYALPDGRVIPFCTFNVLPDLYRDKIQKIYSIPLSEYLKAKGIKSVAEERYKRNIRKLEGGEPYRKYYEGFWDPDQLSYEEKKEISLRFGIPVVED